MNSSFSKFCIDVTGKKLQDAVNHAAAVEKELEVRVEYNGRHFLKDGKEWFVILGDGNLKGPYASFFEATKS